MVPAIIAIVAAVGFGSAARAHDMSAITQSFLDKFPTSEQVQEHMTEVMDHAILTPGADYALKKMNETIEKLNKLQSEMHYMHAQTIEGKVKNIMDKKAVEDKMRTLAAQAKEASKQITLSQMQNYQESGLKGTAASAAGAMMNYDHHHGDGYSYKGMDPLTNEKGKKMLRNYVRSDYERKIQHLHDEIYNLEDQVYMLEDQNETLRQHIEDLRRWNTDLQDRIYDMERADKKPRCGDNMRCYKPMYPSPKPFYNNGQKPWSDDGKWNEEDYIQKLPYHKDYGTKHGGSSRGSESGSESNEAPTPAPEKNPEY